MLDAQIYVKCSPYVCKPTLLMSILIPNMVNQPCVPFFGMLHWLICSHLLDHAICRNFAEDKGPPFDINGERSGYIRNIL